MENRSRLSVSNSLSGRDRQLNEVPAVGDPTRLVQIGTGHRVSVGDRQRRPTFQGGVAACRVVVEEERPESAEQPVGQAQVRRSMAATAKYEELVFEQEILRNDRSDTTGTTQLCNDDGEVKQSQQEVLHG